MARYSVDAVIELLPSLAEALRGRGLRVGTSQLVVAARILRSYADLLDRDYLDEEELALILGSTLAMRPGQAAMLREGVKTALLSARLDSGARRIREEINERLGLLGLRPGDRVVKKRVLSGPRRRDRVAAYLLLRRVGVIRGPPGRERVVGEAEIALISKRMASRGYESLREAAEEGARGWSEDEDLMRAEARLPVSGLDTLETGRLVSLGRAAIRKSDWRLLKAVAEELGRRILRGERVDGEEALRILRKAGSISPAHERALLARDPSLASSTRLEAREIARLATALGWERGGTLVAKALRSLSPEGARELLEGLDPSLLWSAKRHPLRGEEGRLLEAGIKAARSLYEALKYAETGEPGRADMARDLAARSLEEASGLDSSLALGQLSRSTVEALASTALAVVEALDGRGGYEGLAGIIRRLGVTRSLQVLRGLYSRASGEAREIVVRAAASLLYRFASREGLRLLPRNEITTLGPGRLEVRHTLYRLQRLSQEPLVFRRRQRSRRISLALDVSGSMIDHSVWALAIATLFASNIERLTLFAAEPTVLEGPFTPIQLAETLLSIRFSGYTDIARALEAAAARGTRRLVLVSDLKQTVQPGDPASTAAALVRRGYRILAIAPPSHDEATRRALESVGVAVRVAYTPRDAAREVLRSMLR